jgi:hypothetical protein
MTDLSVLPTDPDHLDDLALELLALVHEPHCPCGVLCAVWLRLGLALSGRADADAVHLRTLVRLGAAAR